MGTPEEVEAKQARIDQEGLTAMVSIRKGESWNGRSLWMLALDPVEERWTHMREPESLEEKVKHSPYPISICFDSDITSHA